METGSWICEGAGKTFEAGSPMGRIAWIWLHQETGARHQCVGKNRGVGVGKEN